MLLTIDIGNTNLKFAVFEGNKSKDFVCIPIRDFYPDFFEKFTFNKAAISSVIPSMNNSFADILSNKFNCESFIINHLSKFNIEINYKTPDTLGIDRICSVEGAFSLYKDENSFSGYNKDTYLITVDSGTATTINIVEYPGRFIGGIIMPGLQTMVNALNKNTAQLPKISLEDYKSFIGDDTKSSIASGILNSTLAVIEKTKYYLETKGAKEVIFYLTGGNAKVLHQYLGLRNYYIEDLVLQGVKAIYERNVSEERNIF